MAKKSFDPAVMGDKLAIPERARYESATYVKVFAHAIDGLRLVGPTQQSHEIRKYSITLLAGLLHNHIVEQRLIRGSSRSPLPSPFGPISGSVC